MYEYQAKVERVVDGDTLDLRVDLGFDIQVNTRVRLYGVNCPETRTRDKEEKVAGLAAKDFVRSVLENQAVRLNTTEKGKFGRYLAIIHYKCADGSYRNLNRVLLEQDMAVEYYGGKR